MINQIQSYYESLGYKQKEKITIQFYDNDFFIDKHRVIQFIEAFVKLPFASEIRFSFQTSIPALLRSPEIIDVLTLLTNPILTIGTDTFEDTEMQLIQKLYTMKDVEQVVKSLEEHKIINRHYTILTNVDTTITHLLTHLYNIYDLSSRYCYFHLTTINTYLCPSMGTAAFDRIKSRDLFEHTRFEQVTSDFIHMKKELPMNKAVNQFLDETRIPCVPVDKQKNAELCQWLYHAYLAFMDKNINKYQKIYPEDCAEFIAKKSEYVRKYP